MYLLPGCALGLLFALGASASATLDPHHRDLLRDLIEVNSGTGNTKGIDHLHQLLIPELRALGFTHRTLEVGGGHRVLVFDFPRSRPQLLIVGHLDTVFAPQSAFQRFADEGSTLRGPGIIDMKGGIVLAVQALAALDMRQLRRVRVVLNDDEEIGSVHSAATLRELAQDIPYGLVFEPAPQSGAVITTQSGVYWVELTARGRAAHAGFEHDKGVNACAELSAELAEISTLTDYERRLTINVGVIEGGTKPNVVCEHATARVDIRYVKPEDLQTTLNRIDAILAQDHLPNSQTARAATTRRQHIASVASLTTESTQELWQLALQTAASLDRALVAQHAGYASDANHLGQIGMQLLVGMGPAGQGMHTDDERMSVMAYNQRLQLTIELLKRLLSP